MIDEIFKKKNVLKIDLASNWAAPILQGMLAAILKHHGAEVRGKHHDVSSKDYNLDGVVVVFGDTTWVREEQVGKWLDVN